MIPGIPLGLAFEIQQPRLLCVCVTHSSLFIVAVGEQYLIICWLGLEVLSILSSFVKLSLRHAGRVARIPGNPAFLLFIFV